MKLKEIDLSSQWDKIGSWSLGNPYSMAFVYPMIGEPFLIKGGLYDCKRHLQFAMKQPYVMHLTFFAKGKTRTNVCFENLPSHVNAYASHSATDPRQKQLIVFRDSIVIFRKDVRKYPRCFPIEIKNLITTSHGN